MQKTTSPLSAGGDGFQAPFSLVGREREMARLGGMLALTEELGSAPRPQRWFTRLDPQARRQPPQGALLTGEMGIGKTRLAEETAFLACSHNWAVVRAHASGQEPRSPYGLWRAILRELMRQELWPHAELASHPLLSHPLHTLLPELPLLQPPAQFHLILSWEQEESFLWDTLRLVLVAASAVTPLLIVLDDLQWSDSSSARLLIFLLRELRGQRVMILGACRENELAEDHPLSLALPDLQRELALALIALAPLDDEAVRTMLEALSIPGAERIVQRSAGNPFFAEHLARAARTARGAAIDDRGDSADACHFPLPIQASFEYALARLGRPCQHVLECGAILGASFSFDAIHALAAGGAARDEDLLLDLLEEAMYAGLLREEECCLEVMYHFAPPLLQEYLYQSLAPRRRASLHCSAAHVLQNLPADNPQAITAEIQRHWLLGEAE